MKTELKKVFIYVTEKHGKTSIEVSSEQFYSTYCCNLTRTVSAPLCEMEIEVPYLSSDEAQKVLHGALLENLIQEREKLRADYHVKMQELTGRIEDLQCIEFKGEDNE